MRSIFFFFKTASVEEVGAFVKANDPSLFSDEEALWGRPYDPTRQIDDSWGEEVIEAVTAALGGLPSCVLTVDVTGRRSGYDEALGLARNLLTKWEGVVGDDYSDYAWRLDKLGQRNAEGRLFFTDFDAASGHVF